MGAAADTAATLAAVGSGIGTAASIGMAGLSVAGALASANAASAAGKAQQAQDTYVSQQQAVNATEATQNANNAAGSGQRAAASQLQQTAIDESNAAGEMAASGSSGSVDENTNLAIIGAEGNYRTQTAMYDGASKAQAFQNQAAGLSAQSAASLAEGQYAASAANTKADTTLLNGASSLFNKYGSFPGATPTNNTNANLLTDSNPLGSGTGGLY
jgi:hypothetical protein